MKKGESPVLVVKRSTISEKYRSKIPLFGLRGRLRERQASGEVAVKVVIANKGFRHEWRSKGVDQICTG